MRQRVLHSFMGTLVILGWVRDRDHGGWGRKNNSRNSMKQMKPR